MTPKFVAGHAHPGRPYYLRVTRKEGGEWIPLPHPSGQLLDFVTVTDALIAAEELVAKGLYHAAQVNRVIGTFYPEKAA
jgi:hypothetical protein